MKYATSIPPAAPRIEPARFPPARARIELIVRRCAVPLSSQTSEIRIILVNTDNGSSLKVARIEEQFEANFNKVFLTINGKFVVDLFADEPDDGEWDFE
jgi:hypothetical protein